MSVHKFYSFESIDYFGASERYWEVEQILSLESVDYFGVSGHYWVVEKKKEEES